MKKAKILYVEDEPNLGQVVCDSLMLQGYEIEWETDGAKVMSKFQNFTPDICILDIMLPNVDGYQLCEHIRAKYKDLPIMLLTAKNETSDLLKGFEAGATDYIRKPFSIEELIARIENQLKIHEIKKSDAGLELNEDISEIKLGSYTYFPQRYELVSPTKTINLSNREGELLKKITEMSNQLIERKDILLQVWGDDSFFNSRNLDVYIKKLRNYLSEDPNIEIQTLRGRGYLFLVK